MTETRRFDLRGEGTSIGLSTPEGVAGDAVQLDFVRADGGVVAIVMDNSQAVELFGLLHFERQDRRRATRLRSVDDA